MSVPYNQVRQRPDGTAIAWHRPEVEDDDAQPWLVIEEDPALLGVEHTWRAEEYVADWTVLEPTPPALSRRAAWTSSPDPITADQGVVR